MARHAAEALPVAGSAYKEASVKLSTLLTAVNDVPALYAKAEGRLTELRHEVDVAEEVLARSQVA